MPPRLRGKWALGIKPRHFTWIVKDRIAVCERPGGYGDNHRRVRRQEEIIWVRENGFACLYSLIPGLHNLHNYDELGITYRHRPHLTHEDYDRYLTLLFREFKEFMDAGQKIIVHGEEVGDRIIGMMGAYIRWCGLVPDAQQAVAITERIAERQLDPPARELILNIHRLPR